MLNLSYNTSNRFHTSVLVRSGWKLYTLPIMECTSSVMKAEMKTGYTCEKASKTLLFKILHISWLFTFLLIKKAYTTDNALCPIMCIYIYRTTECMYDTVVYIAISIHIWHQYKYINLAIWKAPLKNFTKGCSMFIHIFWGWIQWGPCENYIATISIIMWIGATLRTSTFCKSMKKYVNLIHLFTFLLSALVFESVYHFIVLPKLFCSSTTVSLLVILTILIEPLAPSTCNLAVLLFYNYCTLRYFLVSVLWGSSILPIYCLNGKCHFRQWIPLTNIILVLPWWRHPPYYPSLVLPFIFSALITAFTFSRRIVTFPVLQYCIRPYQHIRLHIEYTHKHRHRLQGRACTPP